MEEENRTLLLILQAAREEFLAKGFQGASLRRIVKKAGVTTGAFYRYYPTKEALFEALVKPAADAIQGYFASGLREIRETPPEKQTGEMLHVSADALDQVLDYIYDGHYDAVKMLLCCAGGTAYEISCRKSWNRRWTLQQDIWMRCVRWDNGCRIWTGDFAR